MQLYRFPMISRFTVLVVCLTLTTVLSGQKFVNEFLNIGVGARAHGMFGSVTANTEDVTSAFWNPAGLTGIKNPLEISAMHADWFGGIASYDYMSIGKRFTGKPAVGAITIIRMGIDNIPNTLNLIGPDGNVDFDRVTEFSAADYAFIASYARSMDQSGKFSLGGNIKVIHRSIGSFGSAWGFGADVGAKWKYDKFIVGLTAKDITTTFNAWSFNLTDDEKQTFNETGNDIPVSSNEITLPRFILGLAYKTNISSSISLLAETDINFSTYGTEAGLVSSNSLSVDPTLGIELGFVDKAFLRMGVGNIQRRVNIENFDERVLEIQPNVGLGLKLGRLNIDYALANLGGTTDALVSHIFSLGIAFNKRTRTTTESQQ